MIAPTAIVASSPKPSERSVEEQIASLTKKERDAFDALRAHWDEKGAAALVEYDDYMILRFLRASPGLEKFNLHAAIKVSERYATWSNALNLSNLTLQRVRHLLDLKSMCPLHHTSDVDGNPTLYIRTTITPQQVSANEYIPMMVYILQCLTQSERAAVGGVSILVNLDLWSIKHFSPSHNLAMIDAFLGRFPLRIRRVVIVNCPLVFSAAWRCFKPLLPSDLRDKIVFATNAKLLQRYFPDPSAYPVEMGGKLDFDKHLQEWIATRLQEE